MTVLVVGVVLYLAREILIPIALAVLLTFLLAPIVRRLERYRVPRIAAVIAAVGITGLGVVGVGWLVQGQVMDLAANLPEYKDNIRARLRALRPDRGGVLEEAGDALAEIGKEIAAPAAKKDEPAETGALPATQEPVPVRVIDEPAPPLTYARTMLGPFLSRAATAGIVMVFTIFMLIKREDLRNRILWLIGERSLHRSTPAFDDAAKRVSAYLMMQTLANAAAGLAVGVGLFAMGVHSAPVWALLYAVFRFVPYVGPVLGASLPLALSVATAPDWWQPAMVIGLVLIVEAIVANLLEPLLYGSRTGLSPVAILVAAVFWTWLWGPVGLLLATPLTVCLAVIGRHVPDLAFLEALLGDEPVLSPAASLYQRLLATDQEEAGRIMDSFAKDKDLAEVYDSLFVPVLAFADADRHRNAIDPEHHRAILDMIATLVEDAAPPPAPLSEDQPRVLCLPARDRADEISARMLAHLLGAAGVRAETLSAESLSSEMIQQVVRSEPSAVCISSVPPAAALHARVMRKRIRAHLPDLPLVLGLWGDDDDPTAMQARLGATGADFVVTTLKQAAEQAKSIATTIAPNAVNGSGNGTPAEPAATRDPAVA